MASDRLVERMRARVTAVEAPTVGRVVAVGAGRVLARLPAGRVGQCFEIERDGPPLYAQLVGFDDAGATLLPFSPVVGVAPGASVVATEVGERAPRAEAVLGEVVDALGRSLVTGVAHASDGPLLDGESPSPLSRTPIDRRLEMGVRVIDAMLPFGEGQRVGLFAGSGVGKSTLLAQLASGARADVVVVGLIGERGREVAEFVDEVLGADVRARSTVVVATSDAPPLMRARAAEMATALAESWRAQGAHCLLLVDSLTRYARALRESALVAGEPPARRGYPASVFAALPRLLERAGRGAQGAVSAIYTVLVEGGDMEEPVADEVRGIVDGHWVLRRELAERGHFPAIDVLASVSRVAPRVAPRDALEAAAAVRAAMALLARHGDAVDLGIYQPGTNCALDVAVERRDDIDAFLRQRTDEHSSLDETLDALADLAGALQ